jgi:hypothetical protein
VGPVESSGAPPAVGGRSAKGMLFALVVLLVPVFLLLGVNRLFGGEDPIAVDAAPVYEAARAAKQFPVLEPSGLGDGWVVQSAGFADGTLRIGYLTPERQGIQLFEGRELLSSQLGANATADGSVEAGGRTWQRYRADGGRRALVLVEPGLAVVLAGDADESELLTLATALR